MDTTPQLTSLFSRVEILARYNLYLQTVLGRSIGDGFNELSLSLVEIAMLLSDIQVCFPFYLFIHSVVLMLFDHVKVRFLEFLRVFDMCSVIDK